VTWLVFLVAFLHAKGIAFAMAINLIDGTATTGSTGGKDNAGLAVAIAIPGLNPAFAECTAALVRRSNGL
jgi:hypothetical protein